MDRIHDLALALKESRRLVVFTGAGISCPSGIPDFRSADGLYNRETNLRYPPEQIISHSFFKRDPALFYEFYKSAMVYPDARPNDAHRFFAALEAPDRDVTVVTQNIDGLHQAGGSTRVLELHGSIHRNFCMRCGKAFSLSDIMAQPGVPKCDCGGIIKPDVVLYEEPLDDGVVWQAVNAIEQADVMVVVGTSLAVYPAASYLRYFRDKTLALINKSETPYDGRADLAFHADVIEVVHALQKEL